MNLMINKKSLWYFFLLIPLLEPTYVGVRMPQLNNIFFVLKALVVLICLFNYISMIFSVGRLDLAFDGPIIIFGGYNLYILLVTYINKGDITEALSEMLIILAFLIMIRTSIDDIWIFIKSLFTLLEVLIYLNLITMIIWPEGLYSVNSIGEYWILGLDNSFINYMLPAYCVALLLLKKEGLRLRYLCVITVIFGTFLIRWSVTPFIGICLCTILALFYSRNNVKQTKDYTYIFFGILVIGTILFVFLRVQNVFTYFIADILNKDITFSSRTIIWDRAIRQISNSLMIGYGSTSADTFQTLLRGSHPHNHILYSLFVGGVIGTAYKSIIYIYILRRLRKNSNNCYTLIICSVISAFFIMGITESCASATIQIPLFLACYTNLFNEQWMEESLYE